MKIRILGSLAGLVLIGAVPFLSRALAEETVQKAQVLLPEIIAETVEVAPAWSGHPVGFALLTRGPDQFVAFYDAERNLTIGQRKLGETTFHLTKLPTAVGWDSHNYIAMSIDDGGFLHVAGNMHVVPLIYFRSTRPLDASSLVRVEKMTGILETRVTYPLFFKGPKGEFLFTYRDGSSGNGNQIYNQYDLKTQIWRRLLDTPLFDGEGQRNAYPSLPELGPDGYFHMVWVWRETPDAATNHDPSYARSRDLVHWENSKGEPLTLPITLKSGDIVDAIPEKGGVINGNLKLGFDAQKRVIVSYHKYDANGNTQIYNARSENGAWKIVQVSDWNTRWEFGGGGSLIFETRVGGVEAQPDGTLTQSYSRNKIGSGVWILDPQTLKPSGQQIQAPATPPSLRKVEAEFPDLGVRWASDSGASGEAKTRYVLRWETLPTNRDRQPPGPIPPATPLRLYKLQSAQ